MDRPRRRERCRQCSDRQMSRRDDEDYLEAILVIRTERGFCRNVYIAERMGVTKALSDLGAAGLVRMFGHDVRLTEEGEHATSATLERHRFFERLLVESGVDAEAASAEACRIEHCLLEDSYRRFAAYLGSRRAAARLSPCRTITSFNRPCPNGWVPFTRVHLGQRAEKTCAKPLAEHATPNRTEEANYRCRTPDDSTTEDGHSDHNRTIPATRQAPAWAPFTFQGVSCELRHAAHGRFVKTRPARVTSTHPRLRRAYQSPSGGSIVAQTKRDTVPCGALARCRTGRLEEPWHTQPNAPRPRVTKIATNG